jgi:hypothetical protein
MKREHKKVLHLGNPLRNLVGQPFYKKKPSDKKILDELLNGMTQYGGTCWNPESLDGGTDLMLNQCPGACGEVWKINIKDREVANYLVNEINQRRDKDRRKNEKKPR